MQRISLIFALLLCGKTQGQGYDYNRPVKPFAPSISTTASTFPAPPQSQNNEYSSAPGVQPSSGNGYPSARPVDPRQEYATQPSSGTQIQPSHESVQHFSPQVPSDQYQNQAPSFPGYTGQQPQFPKTKDIRPSSEFPETRPISQFPETRPISQFPGTRPSSQFSDTRPSPQFPETRPSPQFPETRPSPQFPATRPISQFSGTRPSSQFPDIKPSTQFTETRPISQFPATRPSSQLSDTQPGSQFPQTKPSVQFPGFEASGSSGAKLPQQFPKTSEYHVDNELGRSYPETFHDDGQYRGDEENGDYSAIPGEPEIDYPIYSYIPETAFKCEEQQYPGYYADVETRCQIFHICANNKMYDFLCPNGTVFHQEYLVCVWWNQFNCNSAPSLYGINANIYDYSSTYPSQFGLGYSQPAQDPEQLGYTSKSETSQQKSGSTSDYPSSSFTPHKTTLDSRPQSPNSQGYSQQETTPSYSGFTSPRIPGYPSSQIYADNRQGTSSSYPKSEIQKPENGYPRSQPQSSPFVSGLPPQKQTLAYPQTHRQQPESPAFNVPQSAPGYPEQFKIQRQRPIFSNQQTAPGYPTPEYPKTKESTEELGHSFNEVELQSPTTGYSQLQPEGSSFTSPDVGYPGTVSQTPSYPKSNIGAIANYPGRQKPSQEPTTPSVSTSYYNTKSQTFEPTDFGSSVSYQGNDQSPGYPAPSKPTMPFFGGNDIQEQRQYLPPTNG